MIKDRKHIKQSKGLRLQWTAVAAEKVSVVYRSSLDGQFLQPLRTFENKKSTMSVRTDHKLLVP